MAELFDMKELEERVILVAVSTSDEDDTEASLDELEELADTAGATAIGRLVQNREKIHPGTYLGSGKIGELREMVWEMGATGVICDDELSPAQLRNLESALDTKVMDRTMVILDIFAAHATTSEGKIQVELAQLRYRAARLVGLRSSLSRLGGGIGTRGPGEKKLEMDRRLIHERIGQLKSELEDVKRHREVTRKQRDRKYTLSAAIVGYTNAGKSTLLNTLTGAGILAQDKLFATLDPTTRGLKLASGQEILLTDTVGFIRKLPHHLIEAQVIREVLADKGVSFFYNPFYDVTNSIASAWFAKEFLMGDDLLIMNGDVYLEEKLLDRILAQGRSPVMFADESRRETADYKFFYEDGILKKYGKELTGDDVTGEYIGIGRFSAAFMPEFICRMEEMIDRQEHGVWWENVVYSMTGQQPVYVEDVSGHFWAEVDYIEDYERILEHRGVEKIVR